jgi:hypothetical protein
MSCPLQKPKETTQQRLDRLGLNSTVLAEHTGAPVEWLFSFQKTASQAAHTTILKQWREFAEQQKLPNTEITPGLAITR